MNNQALYIGVSGLLSKDVEKVASFYEKLVTNWKSSKRTPFLFLGLQTSRKFLNGESVNPFYVSRMNTIEEIGQACYSVQEFKSSKIIAHYNPSGSYDNPEVNEQILSLMSEYIDGLQWNGFSTKQKPETTPPFPECVSGAINSFRFASILQISQEDYEDPIKSTLKLTNYFYSINSSHLLLDGSGGKGLPIDEQKAITWIKTLRQHNNTKGIAISGGLGIDNLDVIDRIRKEIGYDLEISIDAEGKLRDEENNFSVEKAKAFLEEAIKYYV